MAVESQSQLLNRSLNAGEGTFGWKQVSATFTVPSEADQLTIDAVLRGTGTAWYDDVTLECLGETSVSLQVGAVEKRVLQQINVEASWPDATTWSYRARLRVTNATNEAISGQLWSVNLAGVLHQVRGTETRNVMMVMCGGQRVPHVIFGNTLVFEADLPPTSVRTCCGRVVKWAMQLKCCDSVCDKTECDPEKVNVPNGLVRWSCFPTCVAAGIVKGLESTFVSLRIWSSFAASGASSSGTSSDRFTAVSSDFRIIF